MRRMTALHPWQLAKKRLERFLAEFVNPGDEVRVIGRDCLKIMDRL